MSDFKFWAKAGRLSGLGLTLAAAVVSGLFLGIYIDGKLQTKPLFTILLMLTGIIGGFVYILKEVNSLKWK